VNKIVAIGLFTWIALSLSTRCEASEKLVPGQTFTASSVTDEMDAAYLIGPGDVLGIEVWKDPALTRTVVVLPDGRISVPLIGEIAAGGKTVARLKKEIEQKISRYVPEPVLTLEVKQSNSLYIYVLGRVNTPGRSLLTANINVLQALAMAGGINPFANKNQIKVFRREAGGTRIYPFTYGEVTEGKRLEENIELKRGDVVFVP
jgi:polysaccharide biosynthesis/export protein